MLQERKCLCIFSLQSLGDMKLLHQTYKAYLFYFMNCLRLECSTLSFPALAFELCAMWGNMGEATASEVCAHAHVHVDVYTYMYIHVYHTCLSGEAVSFGATQICAGSVQSPECAMLPFLPHRSARCLVPSSVHPYASLPSSVYKLYVTLDYFEWIFLSFFLSEKNQRFWVISLFTISCFLKVSDERRSTQWTISEKFFLFIPQLPWVLLPQSVRFHSVCWFLWLPANSADEWLCAQCLQGSVLGTGLWRQVMLMTSEPSPWIGKTCFIKHTN